MIEVNVKIMSDESERCEIHLKGSIDKLAKEYTALSKKLASEYPLVIAMSQIYLDEMEVEEVDND